MRSKMIWYLAGSWLVITSLLACTPTEITPEATPVPQAEASVTPVVTITPAPTSTPPAESTPTEIVLEVPATAPVTPTPPLALTAVPLTPAQVIQEEKVKITPMPTPADQGLQGLVRQAQEDLAQRLGLTVEQIDLVELKFVTWPDKGLGCPRPGMVYPQVPQEGALIQLSDGRQIYNYHVGADRPPFLCEQGTP